MPIMPIKTDSHTWLICFSYTLDGKSRFVKEEFTGSIREALFYEVQLRDLAKDGIDVVARQTSSVAACNNPSHLPRHH